MNIYDTQTPYFQKMSGLENDERLFDIEEKRSLGKFQRRRRGALLVLILATFTATLFIGAAGGSMWRSSIQLSGLFLISAGILGRLWCALYIGNRKGETLVESGPYSMTRNPLYLFSALAAAGVGAQTGSLVVTLAFGALTVFAFYFVAVREEEFLQGRFGSAFNSYSLRVPRFVPSFRLYRDEAVVSVSMAPLYTALKDGVVFFVAKPAYDLVEYLQAADFIPVLVRIY